VILQDKLLEIGLPNGSPASGFQPIGESSQPFRNHDKIWVARDDSQNPCFVGFF
jgi:hypothetical protein